MTTIADVITQVSRKYGVDPNLTLADAYLESGLNPRAVGDNGTSFGLFQLHEGGELGNHTASWAYDPYNNANTAISEIARVQRKHPDWSPGQIAAAAERPANPDAYATIVNRYYQTKAWTQSKYAGSPAPANVAAETNTLAQGGNMQTMPNNSVPGAGLVEGIFHTVGNALTAPVQGLQEIGRLSNFIVALLMPSNLMRVGLGFIGMLLLIAGIYFIGKDV